MVDLMPLVYASLIGLSLIGAQAALSDRDFLLVLSTPSQLAASGYTRDVVEDLFLSDMEEVFDARSIIATPVISSVREKTILGALADAAQIGELAFVIQQKVGANPYKVTANFVIEAGKPKVLLSGYSSSQGQFHQTVVGAEGDFRELIRQAARETTRNIDPYFRALYEFERRDRRDASSFDYVDALINEELELKKSSMAAIRHSAFLNLKGLICLEKEDKACALAAFDAAIVADPDFAISRLNRAFTLIELDRYQEAIEEANKLLGPPVMTKLKACLSAAQTLIGVAKWALADAAAAQRHFSEAAAISPKSSTPLIYWSRMLAATGRTSEELQRRLATRQHDPSHIELYAEIAMLYYWLTETDDQPIVRRTDRVPPPKKKVSEVR
jgi:tetratricopeptide (TPR) repeat protein